MTTEPIFESDGSISSDSLEEVCWWSYKDPLGCLRFIKEAWDGDVEEINQRDSILFIFNTSDKLNNKQLIEFLKINTAMWDTVWFSSNKSGKYEFLVQKSKELPKDDLKEEPVGYIVSTGNVVDGLTFYVSEIGAPWQDHEDALKFAETLDVWEVIPVYSNG